MRSVVFDAPARACVESDRQQTRSSRTDRTPSRLARGCPIRSPRSGGSRRSVPTRAKALQVGGWRSLGATRRLLRSRSQILSLTASGIFSSGGLKFLYVFSFLATHSASASSIDDPLRSKLTERFWRLPGITRVK